MKKLNKEDRLLIIEAINELLEILSDWEDNEEYTKELNDLQVIVDGRRYRVI